MTHEEFVLAWSSSSSVDEAVERLEKILGYRLNRQSVQLRAQYYRKCGVRLHKMVKQREFFRLKLSGRHVKQEIRRP